MNQKTDFTPKIHHFTVGNPGLTCCEKAVSILRAENQPEDVLALARLFLRSRTVHR